MKIPKKFRNNIICGNSYYLLQEIPDNSIDIIITSPPYNFNMNYDTHNDKIIWDKYFKKLYLILDECIRVLKSSGRLIINIQPLFSDYIPTHHIISQYLYKKLLWKGEILWEKNNYNCKFCSFGSWKSPSMPYLKYTWEFIEIFCKDTYKKDGIKENIDITGDEFKDWLTVKWSIAPEKRMELFNHPAMFPEKLVYRLLKLFSYKNDIVLDPFNGVGTTTYMAHKLDRRFIGFDISQEYCNTAKKRIKENRLKYLATKSKLGF